MAKISECETKHGCDNRACACHRPVPDTDRSWLNRALASDSGCVDIKARLPKPRIRLKTDQAGTVPASVHCVLLMGTGRRTMWYGAEIDAMRAAFRGEFTRTA